jgi:periplasmic divalent cation tolerance protein
MLIAWTTLATRTDAEGLAADVVGRGLAACVQVEGPIASHYRWEGHNERTEEFRLCLKFLPAQLGELEKHVLANHPYSTPEWLVVRAEHVGEKYLSWAEANFTFSPFHSSQPPL